MITTEETQSEKEDEEEDVLYSLQNLLQLSDDEEDEEKDMTFQFKDKTFSLKVANNDGTIPISLFACNVWNGSIQIASFLAENTEVVRDKTVVELGAGAAFPSIVALAFGATFSVVTDYPNPLVLSNIEENLAKNTEVLGSLENRVFVQGHVWGSCTTELRDLLGKGPCCEGDGSNGGGFDVVIASECLWLHDQHPALLTSIQSLLKPGGRALISFSHHIPGCEEMDLKFFELAKSPYNFQVVQLATDVMPQMFNDQKTTSQYLFSLHC